MTLIFATRNQNKIAEIGALMPTYIKIIGLDEAGIFEEIPENEDTIRANAISKAQYVTGNYGFNCFADDSGLEVEALGGEPGVHSARYAGPKRDDHANMNLLLQRLENETNRKAAFITVIALVMDGKTFTFEGKIGGQILYEKRGNQGFGYDPIFLPEGSQQTFAEMNRYQKNERSHRARALQKMLQFLKE